VSAMPMVRLDEDTHQQLTEYALDLSVVLHRRVSLNEALKVLLPPADGQVPGVGGSPDHAGDAG